MRGQVYFASPSRVFPGSFLFPLLVLVSTLTGCSAEPPSLPVAPPPDDRSPSVLTIWVDGVEVGQLDDPEAIELLCTMLPPKDGEDLLRNGTCTTRDRRVIAAVQDLLHEKLGVGGFSNPQPISWGEIKLTYR